MQNFFEIPMALFAGFLSFLSPCVLPLLPSYLAILTGTNTGEDSPRKNYLLRRTFAFVSGFSIIFAMFGIVFSQAGMMIGNSVQVWTSVAGIVIIMLGLNTMFNFFSILNIEKRFHFTKKPEGFISCILFGAAFGAGWSPCVGPMLASILFMAGSGSVLRSALLLILYSAGLALPFVLAALFFDRLEKFFQFIKRHFGLIKIISGILLIIIGIYMIAGKIRNLSGTFTSWGYRLELFSQNKPFLSDVIFSLLYAALFIMFIVIRIQKRKRLNAEGEKSKNAGLPLLIIASVFGLLAILEAANMISTPLLIASWLRFQGV